MKLEEFVLNEEEIRIYRNLLGQVSPKRIAEFGSGNTTRFWMEETSATIVSWDNNADWVQLVKIALAGHRHTSRVDVRLYDVYPKGNRDVLKDPVVYDGSAFDMTFIDGPRSARQASDGRSGSFAFSTCHTRPGGLIVWHDNDRRHEREMAVRFLGHCVLKWEGRIGWCRWWPKPQVSVMLRLYRRMLNARMLL